MVYHCYRRSWCTDVIPAAVTGLLVVIALSLSGGVHTLERAMVGFAEPVAYFLIGALTLGLAVSHSGLAERVAHFSLRRCQGSSHALYLQLLLSFPLLTLLLPSATTRTGILIHRKGFEAPLPCLLREDLRPFSG